ncbi:ATP-binding cassette domain-containing protein [uncultured Bacteroides sp.]|uniref:AAA family ATPase n=1 Tax=uncultured Bacteroides sp. TaxID=162156 RepID=UPI0026369AB1|nr:ATP-binding cassette domain-containing protein [uncultured Bacteroides sp.]
MAYLRNFAIPKDSWFSKVNIFELNEIGSTYENLLDEISGFGNVSIPCRVPCFNSWYPWKTFYGKDLRPLEFDDITILYGENGSGKTTLLNLIAEKLRISRTSLFYRSSFWDKYVEVCDYELYDGAINLKRGVIITSDDVFKYILENRKNNLEKDNDREQLLKDYYKNHKISIGNITSRYVSSKLRKADEEKSNVETVFRFFVDSVKDDSLILFDEPENSLSAQWQMELSNFLRGAVREFG